jgi:hypothetical protein
VNDRVYSERNRGRRVSSSGFVGGLVLVDTWEKYDQAISSVPSESPNVQEDSIKDVGVISELEDSSATVRTLAQSYHNE